MTLRGREPVGVRGNDLAALLSIVRGCAVGVQDATEIDFFFVSDFAWLGVCRFDGVESASQS